MDPFIGEIRLLPYTYAPQDWLPCDGRTLYMASYQALYAVIGVQYGSEGSNTFKLPDLRGRAPMDQGSGPGLTPRLLAAKTGNETVTLTGSALPAHTHTVSSAQVDVDDLLATPTGNWQSTMVKLKTSDPSSKNELAKCFAPPVAASLVPLAQKTLSPALAGAVQPHENRQPYLAVQFCICWNGIFPVRP